MSLLQVRNLTISFGANTVVRDASFTLNAGEKLALVGESGSGKTVTALSLLGLVEGAQLTGEVLLKTAGDVQDLTRLPARQLRALCGRDVALIFQEPMTALNPVYTIGNQIAEVLQLHRGLNDPLNPSGEAVADGSGWADHRPQGVMQRALKGPALRDAVHALLEQTGIAEPARCARSYAHQLSGGQRQRAMIAMALAGKPKLLLADEPTTALDPSVRRQILDLLNRIQQDMGLAILLITHDLPLVRRFADRVAVMAHGRIVEQGSVADIFERPQQPTTRALLASQLQRDVPPLAPAAPAVLAATALRVSYAAAGDGGWRWRARAPFVALHGADFSVHEGQTLGVVGESGSGKSSLALAALGLLTPQQSSNSVTLFGRPWGQNAATDLRNRKDVQVVFQDPFSSLSPRLTLEQIVGEGLRVHAPQLGAADVRARVVQALTDVGLMGSAAAEATCTQPTVTQPTAAPSALLQRYPHQFSGGQRQRIAIARALVVQPRVLVLDEPTSALDASMAQQIVQLLQRLHREKGLAYLLISHDVAVIRALAHHVLVLQNGHVVAHGPLQTLDSELDAMLERPSGTNIP